MRKWIVLALVLVVVAAGWPLFVGGQVERSVGGVHEARLGEVELRHEMLEYRRGYLDASAHSRLILDDGEAEWVIPLVHEVRHGLLGARGDSFVDLDALQAPEGALAARLLREADLQLHTRAGLGGGVTTRVRFEPLRLDLMEIPEVAARAGIDGALWLELAAGQGRFAWSAEQILLSLDVPEARLSDPVADLVAEDLRYVTLFEADDDGAYGRLPDYEAGLAAASLRSVADGERLELERPRLNALQSTGNGRMDSHLRLQFDQARLEDGDAAPLEFGALDLQLAALRWDRQALLHLIDELESLAAADLPREQYHALVWSAVTDAIQEMIEHRPALVARAALNGEPARALALDAELALHGTAQAFTTRPLETLVLDSELRLGMEWVRAFDTAWPEVGLEDRLRALAAEGWLQRDAEQELWRGRLTMEDARVRVNDVERTAALLALLFGLAGGMF